MAGTREVKINTKPVADNYAGPQERIIEFSSPNGGGLIAFCMHPDGRLGVQVYRTDSTVYVTHAPGNFDPAQS